MDSEEGDVRRARHASRRPDCVLASNTSTLDIDEFARASGRPAPGDRPSLLQPGQHHEAARDRPRRARRATTVIATSVQAWRSASARCRVVVGNCFGFVANRMLAYYMREAYSAARRGARACPQIDQRAHGLRHAGRPVRHAGHRRHRRRRAHPAASRRRSARRARRDRSPEVPDRLFEMGRYGQKTGAGWYRYEARQPRARFPIR